MIKSKIVLVPFPFDDLSSVTTALFLRELGELPSRMQDELDNRIRCYLFRVRCINKSPYAVHMKKLSHKDTKFSQSLCFSW